MRLNSITALIVVSALLVGCDTVLEDGPIDLPDTEYALQVRTDTSYYDRADAIQLEVTNQSSVSIYYPCDGVVYLDEQSGPTWKVYGDESCTAPTELKPDESWTVTLDLWSLQQEGSINALFGYGASYRLSIMVYSDEELNKIINTDQRRSNQFLVIVCPEPKDGYVDYFSIDVGDTMLFDYEYRRSSMGGLTRRIGDLKWTILSTACADGVWTYDVKEEYSGVTQHYVDEWVDTGTDEWVKELEFVKSDSLHLAGYTQRPIPWSWPDDSPEVVTFDQVISYWPPITSRVRLDREHGLIFRSWSRSPTSGGDPSISVTMTRPE